MEEKNVCLGVCNPGDTFTVTMVKGDAERKKHLMDMGFFYGSNVNIVSKINDNMIISVMDTKIGINEEISSSIYGVRTNIKEEKKGKIKILSLFKK